jgi:hypothetical protein
MGDESSMIHEFYSGEYGHVCFLEVAALLLFSCLTPVI